VIEVVLTKQTTLDLPAAAGQYGQEILLRPSPPLLSAAAEAAAPSVEYKIGQDRGCRMTLGPKTTIRLSAAEGRRHR
jgi:hypothetical protein